MTNLGRQEICREAIKIYVYEKCSLQNTKVIRGT